MSTKKLQKDTKKICTIEVREVVSEIKITFNKKDGTRETRTYNADDIRKLLQTYENNEKE